jgi:hypothetical protein
MTRDRREVGTAMEVTKFGACDSWEHGIHARRNALERDEVSGIDQLWFRMVKDRRR